MAGRQRLAPVVLGQDVRIFSAAQPAQPSVDLGEGKVQPPGQRILAVIAANLAGGLQLDISFC
jgi:hypothetical protein